MTSLLIADIHSNLVALESVLESAPPFDCIVFAGDVVGYGPRPNECINRLRGYALYAVLGNHDAAVIGKKDLRWFGSSSRQIIQFSRDVISSRNEQFLEGLPEKLTIEDQLMLVHGSPRSPLSEYIRSRQEVVENLNYLQLPVTVVGHTHVPAVYEVSKDAVEERKKSRLDMNPDLRYIVNPGSVGQPRDGDPRASYALLDPESKKVVFKRVAYDVQRVQQEMRNLGFPNFLRRRLSRGV